MRHPSLFTRMHFAAGLALVVGLIWGGCSVIPPPTPDPTRYYLLTAESGASPPPAVSTGSFHLGIRSVDAPGYLRTNRSMVIRRGVNELRYEDFARWVEPIDAAVQRVVRDRLLASESVATADAAPFPAATKRDFDVAIRILRCEGALDAQGKSSAQFSARYEILDPSKGGEVIARRIFVAPAASWDGANYAQLAQSLAEAAAGLGDDIVKNLPLAK